MQIGRNTPRTLPGTASKQEYQGKIPISPDKLPDGQIRANATKYFEQKNMGKVTHYEKAGTPASHTERFNNLDAGAKHAEMLHDHRNAPREALRQERKEVKQDLRKFESVNKGDLKTIDAQKKAENRIHALREERYGAQEALNKFTDKHGQSIIMDPEAAKRLPSAERKQLKALESKLASIDSKLTEAHKDFPHKQLPSGAPLGNEPGMAQKRKDVQDGLDRVAVGHKEHKQAAQEATERGPFHTGITKQLDKVKDVFLPAHTGADTRKEYRALKGELKDNMLAAQDARDTYRAENKDQLKAEAHMNRAPSQMTSSRETGKHYSEMKRLHAETKAGGDFTDHERATIKSEFKDAKKSHDLVLKAERADAKKSPFNGIFGSLGKPTKTDAKGAMAISGLMGAAIPAMPGAAELVKPARKVGAPEHRTFTPQESAPNTDGGEMYRAPSPFQRPGNPVARTLEQADRTPGPSIRQTPQDRLQQMREQAMQGGVLPSNFQHPPSGASSSELQSAAGKGKGKAVAHEPRMVEETVTLPQPDVGSSANPVLRFQRPASPGDDGTGVGHG